MPSLSSRAATAYLRVTRSKETYRSPAHVRDRVDRQLRRPKSFVPPRLLSRLVAITVTTRQGWRCYELTPRRGPAGSAPVLYLHGGAYVFEISLFHWLALAQLVSTARVPVLVPIYPLAPLSTAAETVATAARIATDLVEASDPGTVTVMGDSAGGGLALAVAQQLRDAAVAPLRRVVLIAPWLDVSMTEPDSAAIDPYDAMLHGPGCAEAGRIYAGDLPVDDPRVSPIHGDLTGLPPITVFSGTHDILHPEARRLVTLAQEAGVAIDHHVLAEGQHAYPLYPMREGLAALRQISALVAAVD